MGIPYAPYTSVYSSCMSYTQRSKPAAWLKHSVEMRWIHTSNRQNLSEEGGRKLGGRNDSLRMMMNDYDDDDDDDDDDDKDENEDDDEDEDDDDDRWWWRRWWWRRRWWWWWWWWYGGAMYDQPLANTRPLTGPRERISYPKPHAPPQSKKIDSFHSLTPRAPPPPRTVQESILLEISSPNTAKEEETPAGTLPSFRDLKFNPWSWKPTLRKFQTFRATWLAPQWLVFIPKLEKFKSCAVDYSYVFSIKLYLFKYRSTCIHIDV